MSLMSRARHRRRADARRECGRQRAGTAREHIQRFVSTDDIAAIMAEQPSRARNELKSACRQAFEDASGRASSASSSG
ncbi:MAG: hypothetical protein ACLSVD_00920 [Eggerthellaceae bacterium]